MDIVLHFRLYAVLFLDLGKICSWGKRLKIVVVFGSSVFIAMSFSFFVVACKTKKKRR